MFSVLVCKRCRFLKGGRESAKKNLLCSVKTISWGGVGGGSVIYYWLLLAIISILITRHNFHFFRLVLTLLNSVWQVVRL